MPFKDKAKDRAWHRQCMRQRRAAQGVTPQIAGVTPLPLHSVTPRRGVAKMGFEQPWQARGVGEIDEDGYPIPDD